MNPHAFIGTSTRYSVYLAFAAIMVAIPFESKPSLSKELPLSVVGPRTPDATSLLDSPFAPDVVFVQSRLETSVLKRRELPPPMIRPRLVSQDPAGANTVSCNVGGREFASQTLATPSECVAEITDTLQLTFSNFRSQILVSLTKPDGQLQRFNADNEVSIYVDVGDPLGVYTFVATDGQRTKSGGFMVKSSTKRVVWIVGAENGVFRGDTMIVDLAGYRPFESVALYLYRAYGHRDYGSGQTLWEYRASIGRTQMTARGEARIEIPTERDDPLGNYYIISDPRQADSDINPGTFTLVARPH